MNGRGQILIIIEVKDEWKRSNDEQQQYTSRQQYRQSSPPTGEYPLSLDDLNPILIYDVTEISKRIEIINLRLNDNLEFQLNEEEHKEFIELLTIQLIIILI